MVNKKNGIFFFGDQGSNFDTNNFMLIIYMYYKYNSITLPHVDGHKHDELMKLLVKWIDDDFTQIISKTLSELDS